MFNPVRIQIRLAAAPERVFQALTNTQALEAWFCEHADITGQHYSFWGRFTPEAPSREAGQHPLVVQTAPQELSYDWRLKGAATRVTIKLLPRDSTTLLLLWHDASETSDDHFYHLEDFWFLSLENLRRYLDGKPSEARVDYTNAMRGDIHHETLVDAPPERVFEVLLRPKEVERWIATHATIEPVVGGKYDLGWGESTQAVKILELVPNERLSLNVPEDPNYGNANRAETIMTWTLEESGGKTRLTFTHSGFDSDEDVSHIYTGWRTFLNWVRSVAEYGVDWQPPLPVLSPDAIGYAASIIRAQSEIAEELKA